MVKVMVVNDRKIEIFILSKGLCLHFQLCFLRAAIIDSNASFGDTTNYSSSSFSLLQILICEDSMAYGGHVFPNVSEGVVSLRCACVGVVQIIRIVLRGPLVWDHEIEGGLLPLLLEVVRVPVDGKGNFLLVNSQQLLARPRRVGLRWGYFLYIIGVDFILSCENYLGVQSERRKCAMVVAVERGKATYFL